jgi:hypothetical protein
LQSGIVTGWGSKMMFSNVFTTAYGNEIVCLAGQSYTNVATYTAGSGWTLDGGSSLAGAQIAAAEHRLFTSTQNGITASMTDSNTDPYQLFICCFGVAASTSPAGTTEGQQGYCTNGLKRGETSGTGTGVPVYWSQGFWRIATTDVPVSA